MRTTRPHWSYSALNQYMRCPLQYYFERVIRLPKPTVASGLVLGGAVHEALAYYHTQLRRGRKTGIQKLQKVFFNAWQDRENDQTVQYKSSENRVSQIAVGITLLETYLEADPPENIFDVELELIVPLINSRGEFLETPLVAVLDLITTTDDGLKVHEIKTSGKAYGEFETDTSLQATTYAHACHSQYGVEPEVEYLVLVKTKQLKLQKITTIRTEEDFGRLGDIAENIERAVKEKIFFPVESPLNCSGCPFRGPCREWQPQKPLSKPIDVELNGCATC